MWVSAGNGRKREGSQTSSASPAPTAPSTRRPGKGRGAAGAARSGRGGCARALSAAPGARRGTLAGGARRRHPLPAPPAGARALRPARASEAEQTLGELFPLAFIGNTCSGAAGRGAGEGREFSARPRGRLGAARVLARSPPPSAPRGRGRGNSAGTGPWARRARAGRRGPALPWWFSSGMYILVFSLTMDQKLF